MKKNVLILGGSSDIGIELTKKFLDKKIYDVNLHYNSNSKVIKNLKNKCKLIKADLSNSSEKLHTAEWTLCEMCNILSSPKRESLEEIYISSIRQKEKKEKGERRRKSQKEERARCSSHLSA